MSPKFPVVTSDEVIKVLQKIGFRFKRQSGSSHAVYYREADKRRTNVPIHKGKIKERPSNQSSLMQT
ncbi:MAG: type II toxin-antitoxin system HicA family toxin [Nitrospirota bacterium]